MATSPMTIDTSFAKGRALANWFMTVTGTSGSVAAEHVYSNILSLDSTKAQQWATSAFPEGPRVFTVNVPVGVPSEQQCGKGVHIDAHVNNSSIDVVGPAYPTTCNTPLNPSENMLAFFFFDLASCIQKDNEPPRPPPVN